MERYFCTIFTQNENSETLFCIKGYPWIPIRKNMMLKKDVPQLGLTIRHVRYTHSPSSGRRAPPKKLLSARPCRHHRRWMAPIVLNIATQPVWIMYSEHSKRARSGITLLRKKFTRSPTQIKHLQKGKKCAKVVQVHPNSKTIRQRHEYFFGIPTDELFLFCYRKDDLYMLPRWSVLTPLKAVLRLR